MNVGTSTVNSVPARGPEPITRVSRARRLIAATRVVGPEQRRQHRQVVRPEVEQRPRALREQELRVRVPRLGPRPLQQGERADRGADRAGGDQPPGRLDARAEHGVGRAADPHPGRAAWSSRARPAATSGASGFSFHTCLPAAIAAEATSACAAGNGQVHHQLHVRVLEGLLHAARRRDAVGGRLRLGPARVDVGAEQHPHVGERGQVLQVLLADVPAADDGDPERLARRPACRPTRPQSPSGHRSALHRRRPGRARPARPGCRRRR